jgi:hypothetical protein
MGAKLGVSPEGKGAYRLCSDKEMRNLDLGEREREREREK